MKRLTFQQIYMKHAEQLAKRSTCSRLQVGSVITSDDYRYIYGQGYNGVASGLPNKCKHPKRKGNCLCLHSEQNAVISNTAHRSYPKIVFVTHSPCWMCSQTILNMGGVKEVYYKHKYRDTSGLDLLTRSGILVVNMGRKK